MRLAVIVVLVFVLSCQGAFPAHTVEKAVDPSLLPYQFKTHTVVSHTGDFAPMPIQGQTRMGAYEIGHHWHDDSLSLIVFYRDLLAGGAINQVNRNVWYFISSFAGDLDRDGVFEVAVTYQQGTEVWIEIVEVSGETQYKRPLLSVEDRNRNGKWEGGCSIQALEDLNGDGTGEFLLSVFSGFDLYPRAYFCLDWHNDSVLWAYDVSGLPSDLAVIRNASGHAGWIVLCIMSMGNDVSTSTMDDQHSYLICLDGSGNEAWTRVLGGVFCEVAMLPFDIDNDGVSEVLTYANFGDSDTSGEKGSLIRVFSTGGILLDTLRLPEGSVARQVISGDLDSDGNEEILLSTSDGLVVVYDAKLNELSQHQFEAEVHMWKCADFLGKGTSQLIASTVDGKTFLLDDRFNLLAQFDGLFHFRGSHTFESDLVLSGPTLLLRDRDQTRSLVMYFEKQPFLTMLTAFMFKYQRAFLTILGILAAALLFTNYHRRRIRRNLKLISRQRDELEQTRNELQKTMIDLVTAQSRLVQSEKMASLGMLVAGVAHEINTPVGAINSMHDTLVRAVDRLETAVEKECSDGCGTRQVLRDYQQVIDEANKVIKSGTERVTNIVKRLRSFARLDEAELKTTDVNECLEDTLTLIHHEIKHNIEVIRNYGDIPEITCYPGQLNQVFLNLLINAKQAIDGKGWIKVTTFTKDGKVVVEFSDSGRGIDDANLTRIFDPGFTTKGVGVGTGLGLSICYQIIQSHRGEIVARSKVGEGTTFTVRLPTNLDNTLEKS